MSTEIEENVKTEEVDLLTSKMTSIAESIDSLNKVSKSLTADLKVLQKELSKVLSKSRKKSVKKPIDPDAPKKVNALEKPVAITDELRTFLGLEKDTLYSRQTITKARTKTHTTMQSLCLMRAKACPSGTN